MSKAVDVCQSGKFSALGLVDPRLRPLAWQV